MRVRAGHVREEHGAAVTAPFVNERQVRRDQPAGAPALTRVANMFLAMTSSISDSLRCRCDGRMYTRQSYAVCDWLFRALRSNQSH